MIPKSPESSCDPFWHWNFLEEVIDDFSLHCGTRWSFAEDMWLSWLQVPRGPSECPKFWTKIPHCWGGPRNQAIVGQDFETADCSHCGPFSLVISVDCRLVEHCGTRHFRVPYLPSFQPIYFLATTWRYRVLIHPPLVTEDPHSFADGAFDVVLNVSDSTQLGSAPGNGRVVSCHFSAVLEVGHCCYEWVDNHNSWPMW